MNILENYESINKKINANDLYLIYVKSKDCAVCNVMLPRVLEKVNQHSYPGGIVIIDDIPKFAGQFSVYAVPAVLIFVMGKEVYRQAGFLQINELEKELVKWKKMIE